MAARQSLGLTSFHGPLLKRVSITRLYHLKDDLHRRKPLGDLTFRGAPEGEKMGRAQQSVVFIVVVLSIALYLALRQLGPAPLIGGPPSATVPIPL